MCVYKFLLNHQIISNTIVPNIVLLTSLDRCVGVSDQLQLFAKEQERKKLLYSSAPQTSDTAPAAPKTPSNSKSTTKENTKTPAAKKIQKAGGGGNNDVEEASQRCGDKEADTENEDLDGEGGKGRGKSGAKRKTAGRKSSVKAKQTQPEIPIVQPTPAECENSLNFYTIYNRYY